MGRRPRNPDKNRSFTMSGTPEFGEWFDGLARATGLCRSAILSYGVSLVAKANKYPLPPVRTPAGADAMRSRGEDS